MKDYIHRMDGKRSARSANRKQPPASTDIPKSVLDYPSYAQAHRSARYIRWLQGINNSIQRVKELVRSKAFVAGIDSETAFVFGNSEETMTDFHL
ncbi:hypothetical protein PI126_g18543 [Phytophthora idaei]|nr:hypothetical protein PI126_g18543 [Phytophthora idaei]